MIHVAYSLYDKDGKYSKFVGTSMLSIFENTSADVTVHILHDKTLTNDNREKFSYVAGRYNQRVIFHNVEETCAAEIEKITVGFSKELLDRFSTATFLRLFAAKVIPQNVTKVIYLDSDTIINLDVAEMWRVELGDKPLAAVLEWEDTRVSQYGLTLCRAGLVKPEEYFNAGITIMNLSRLRREESRIWGGVQFIINNPQHHLVDQDILNYCFSTEYLKLPSKFNTWVYRDRRAGKSIERKIYHYIGQASSLGLNGQDIFHRLYWEYFAKTPWFSSETILNFGTGLRQMFIERQNLLVHVSAMLSGKTRAFFVEPASVPALKQIFAVQEGEEIFTLTSDDSVQELLAAMNESRGRKVFFLLILQPAIYDKLREMLTRAGFVEWRDFVNAVNFLSDAQGVPLNTWAIIKNL